ncbi:ATP-grasp domain-containing protein [Streptomyces sp. ISL-10]|uniref:ATP-grasp domain-containing protein n=1 Tax=Streptomyces sp. ISL-10 TaxID=2819172 RepID=UPI001BEAE911|nr:ATP-grasp domain-containing protein [Streptomyces sp. ISL-10]MBT2365573.1 ATP-grasp domain-containing protein [Streptomyces sp. ISL-10]
MTTAADRPLAVVLHSRQPLTTDVTRVFPPQHWDVVVLTDADPAQAYREDVPGTRPVVRTAPRDTWAATLRSWSERRPVEIVSNDEYCLLDCAALRAESGLATRHPEHPVNYIDKVLMKERLTAAGVRTPRFLAFPRVPEPKQAYEEVLDHIGLPAVAKPRREANSRGVSILRTQDALRAWLAERRGQEGWQLEEFLDGTFHHANSLVRDGKLTPVQAGTYLGPLLDLTAGRRLGGWTVPHCDPLAHRAHELNRQVVDALGGGGAFVVHTEFAVTRDGETAVVEVAARAPGALLPDLSRLHAGVNLEEAHLALQAGLPVPEPVRVATEAAWLWIPVLPGERHRTTPRLTGNHRVDIRQAARTTHRGEAGTVGVSVLLWHNDPEVLAADVRTAATAAWCGQ